LPVEPRLVQPGSVPEASASTQSVQAVYLARLCHPISEFDLPDQKCGLEFDRPQQKVPSRGMEVSNASDNRGADRPERIGRSS
jgi:hypothetical protein